MNTARVLNLHEYKTNNQSQLEKINSIFKMRCTSKTEALYTVEICKFFNVKSLSEISIDKALSISSSDVLEYLNTYIHRSISESYVKLIRSSLAKYYSTIKNYSDEYELNLIKINPATQDWIIDHINSACISAPSNINIEDVKILDKSMVEEYIQIIDEVEGNPKLCERNKLAFKIMVNSGIRREELTKLTLENIVKFNNGEEILFFIKIIGGKGAKSRLVNIHEDLYNSVQSYANSFGLDDDAYVIGNGMYNKKMTTSSINKMFDKYSKHVSDDSRLAPHDTRRICAITNLQAGNDIRNIQKILGHSDVKTTEIYLERDGSNIKKINMVNI